MKINKSSTPHSLTHIFDSFLNPWDQEFRYSNKFQNLGIQNNFEPNYYEDDKKLVIEFILPGYSRDQVELQVDNNILKLETKDSSDEEKKSNFKTTKKFKQNFQIPNHYDTSKITAKLHDGILEISLSKKISPKPKKIKIN
ncbi:MAG: Hsp20/alpha crystallin family protein [Opitutae bacterium]|jgi:HSP20 family protein|nr:Hsp20/alpha crystallin family protein [Opitutae bacterium]